MARLTRLALACALAALALVPTTAQADSLLPVLGGSCGATARVFAPWNDPFQYYPATNGGLERGSTGWVLTGGARVVPGNEPFYVHAAGEQNALALPAGGSGLTPPICFGVTSPTLRFFASAAEGNATVRVRVVSWSLLGVLSVIDGGSVQVGPAWAPTPAKSLLGSALGSLAGAKAIQLLITSNEDVVLDDLYVDPFLQKG